MTEKEPTSTAQHDQSVGENSKRQRVSLATQIVPGLQQIFFALRMGTIRTRLPVAFVVMVLLPAAAIIATSVVGGLQGGRQQVFNQLESVATLKEAEITTGLQELQLDLSFELSRETAPQQISNLLQLPPDSASFQAAYDEQLARFQQAIELRKKFEELSLVSYQGQVILSTDPAQKGKIYATQTYFKRGLEGPYINPPTFSLVSGRMVIMVAHPIKDQQGQVIGVLAGRVSMATLNEIMNERAGLGQTGETYLVGSNRALLTELRSAENLYVRTQGVNTAIENQANGSGDYENYHGVLVIGVYHWLPELQVVLLAEQDQSEALRATYTTRNLNVGVALASVLLAVLVSLLITRSIASPLADLAKTATQIAAGDLERAAEVKREDEIGAVAQAFNRMTTQLRGLIGSLEQRVAERTAELTQRSQELEKLNLELGITTRQTERRAVQLAARGQVTHTASQIRDLDQLLPQVTHLISQAFGYYHVGVFMADEAGRYAVLRAANSEGGQRMLARNHKLAVGAQGMVGYVVGTGQPRIALDVGADAIHFDNPDLPETRSEIALPLQASGQTFGALDVQSTQGAAFTDEDIAILGMLADQVAIAIENARLLAQAQATQREAEETQRHYLRQEWERLMPTLPSTSHEYHMSGVLPVGNAVLPEIEQAAQQSDVVTMTSQATARSALAVPIKLRDQVIGVIDLHETDAEREWTADDVALVMAVADQAALALENAHLLEQTQQRARREQLVTQIATKVRAAADVDGIMRAGVQEIRRVLGASHGIVHLRTESQLPIKDKQEVD